MTKKNFTIWAKEVRDAAYREITMRRGIDEMYPEAILVSGEYLHAFMDDWKEIQLTKDGGYLWRGIPLVRCSGVTKAAVVWSVETLNLPSPDEYEKVVDIL